MVIDDFKSGRELLDQNKRCTNLDLDLGLRPPKNTVKGGYCTDRWGWEKRCLHRFTSRILILDNRVGLVQGNLATKTFYEESKN